MTFTALLTWFLSKFTVKGVLITVFLAAIVGAGWYGYDKLYDSIYAKGQAAGVASQANTIKGLQNQVAADKTTIAQAQAAEALAKSQLASYVDSYNKFVAQQKANDAALAQQQAAITATLNKQLANAQTEFSNDLPTLLPLGDTCDMPIGVVLLYNDSIAGTDPTGGFTTSFSLPANANNPSGVSCSAFAGVVLDNNLAAYSNRYTLILWQSWYTQNKTVIDQIIAAAKATPVPVTPTSPAPIATTPSSSTPAAKSTSGK
jgi:hypothetical protein